jgi:HAMP domain-containing protein
MDIRTKLVFALVAVAVGSMAVLGAFAYRTARDSLRDSSRQRLEAVAVSRLDDLDNVTRAWHDRAHLISTRTQLRLSLRAYRLDHDPEERERVARIIGDALRAVPSIRRITVFDVDGHVVASATRPPGGAGEGDPEAGLEPSDIDPGTLPGPGDYDLGDPFLVDGELHIAFDMGLEIDGDAAGWAHIVIGATELIDITDDFEGLGETGEILLAAPVPNGGALILNATRHGPAEPMSLHIPDDGELRPPLVAVSGSPPATMENAVDYRGQQVWAATRHLQDLGWGLVVKFDAEEQDRPVRELRDSMVRVGISLSAFAVVVGTLLGLWFARPIRQLAAVADRIRNGELHVRAEVESADEIGLARRSPHPDRRRARHSRRRLRIGVRTRGLRRHHLPLPRR